MTVSEMGVLLRGMAPAVKEYVAEELDGHRERQDLLSARLKVVEERTPLEGAKGAKGDLGDVGPRGQEGPAGKDADPTLIDALRAQIVALQAQVEGLKSMPATLEVVRDEPPDIDAMVKAAVTDAMAQVQELAVKAVADLPRPRDGQSITVEDVAPLIAVEVSRAVGAIPPAQVDPSEVEAVVVAQLTKAVAEFPRPKDGLSLTPADVAPLIVAEVAKAVALIPIPKDGDSVMDALIARDGHLVLTLSDGTTKDVGPVVGRDVDMQQVEHLITAEVAKIPLPNDGADGFGFDDFEEVFDGERTYTRRYKQGDRVKEFTFKVAYVLDRGVYKPDTQYEKGDGVTWGGSFWIAQEDTKSKPGDPGEDSRAWRLAVKKGGEGKVGPQGPAGVKGQTGESGRDSRYS